MRIAIFVLALAAIADARLLRGAADGGPTGAPTAPYYSTAALGSAAAASLQSDLPATGGKGGAGRPAFSGVGAVVDAPTRNAEGTALPGFASAGKAAAAAAKPALATETHNNGGAGLPEGTALPMFGSTAGVGSGPGPATPAAAVDTSLARKEAEPAAAAPAVPAPAPEAAEPQPDLKTSSVPFNGAGAAAAGYLAAQAGAAP